ncbi:MAG: galactokinase family protein [Ilumatobacteraceae bacterium]
MTVHVLAPGRVNLIGDHTDYTGGLVLPMAIDRYTEIRGVRGGDRVHLTSFDDPDPVDLPLQVDDPRYVSPAWGKYVAGVVAEMHPAVGFNGHVTTDIPIGGGMSSSHALQVAVALALGFDGSIIELAKLTQRSENKASGVPTGIMDQLAIAAGVAGHALLIDCGELTVTPVPLPHGIEIVVQFIAHRTLVGSAYAERVAECAAAEREIGPLRHATAAQAKSIADPIVRSRAMHVISENLRVLEFAEAMRHHDLTEAGRLMVASHHSLRDQYGTSTPVMDAAVAQLVATPGVYGARMTGGGFGGCVVALTEPAALTTGWVVQAVGGAAIVAE